MTFAVAADSYDRFMGRYSVLLAPQLAALADVAAGQRVLDVGSGPGALTTELVRLVGAERVTAVDPSEPFVAAARERHPGVTVERAGAEQLPFPDESFDAALAQLVVHFMTDPVGGLREMARVTRGGGVVAACVWDHGGGQGPLSPFWEAVHELDPAAPDESDLPGTRSGQLTGFFQAAGLREVAESSLSVSVEHPTFEDWWEPFTLGVGPAGAFVGRLTRSGRRSCESAATRGCRSLLSCYAAACARDSCELARDGLAHVGRAGPPPRRSRRTDRDSGGARRRALPRRRPRARALVLGGPPEHLGASGPPGTSSSASRSPARPSFSPPARCFPATAATSRSVDRGRADTDLARSGRHTRGDRLAGVRRRARP